jgi:hypothetical protein
MVCCRETFTFTSTFLLPETVSVTYEVPEVYTVDLRRGRSSGELQLSETRRFLPPALH